MHATGQDLSNINCHFCNKFGLFKNDCADFKAVHQQNQRRRRKEHKHRGGVQLHQPKPRGQQQQRGWWQMWCSCHKTTTHNDASVSTTAPPYANDGFEIDSAPFLPKFLCFLLVRPVHMDVIVNASLSCIFFSIWPPVAVHTNYFMFLVIDGLGGGYLRNTRRFPRQATTRAQRRRPLRPCPSSRGSCDLQLVGFPYAR